MYMWRRHQLSAMQLAGLAILGSMLLASVFLLPLPVERWFHAMGWLGRLLASLPLFAAGITLMLLAESRFKNGVQNSRWSEEEIAPVRELLLSPWCRVFSIAMLIASAVLMFVEAHHYRGIGWALLIFGQSATRLQMAFRQPTPKNPSRPNWTNFSPIQSDLWGKR